MKIVIVLILSLFSVSSWAQKAQLIYVLQQDAFFTYFDKNSKAQNYWTKTLLEAQANSNACIDCDVLVFQRSEAKSPKEKSGQFSKFKNGKLVTLKKYSYMFSETFFLEEELKILQLELPLGEKQTKRYFYYFGHMIPEANVKNYYHSFPEKQFSMMSLIEGLKKFVDQWGAIDVLTLSSCENGSPITIYYLNSVANLVLASPGKLYLSMMNTKVSSSFDVPLIVAREMMKNSFESLKNETKTEVTLALYDTQKVAKTLHSNLDLNSEFQSLYRDVYGSSSHVPSWNELNLKLLPCEETKTKNLSELPIESFLLQQHLLELNYPKRSGWSCVNQM